MNPHKAMAAYAAVIASIIFPPLLALTIPAGAWLLLARRSRKVTSPAFRAAVARAQYAAELQARMDLAKALRA